LEIPTPSWLVYDRKIYGIEIPEGAVLKEQERAYTSPIWYTPEAKTAAAPSDRIGQTFAAQ
jgi:hypothetical protein